MEKVLMLIYGKAGMGKTTFSISSSNPILFDFDNGARRLLPMHTIGTQIVDKPNVKILEEMLENPKSLELYDTIVIDSLSRLVENLIDTVCEAKNIKPEFMPISEWKTVGIRWKRLVSKLKNIGKSVVFVDHEKRVEMNMGAEIVTEAVPLCRTSNKDELLKDLDLVGYMFLKNGERKVSFSPCQSFYAKNSANFDEVINITKVADFNGQLANIIIEASEYKNKENKRKDEALKKLEKMRQEIADFKTEKEANAFLQKMKQEEQPIFIMQAMLQELRNIMIRFGITFDSTSKAFKVE